MVNKQVVKHAAEYAACSRTDSKVTDVMTISPYATLVLALGMCRLQYPDQVTSALE